MRPDSAGQRFTQNSPVTETLLAAIESRIRIHRAMGRSRQCSEPSLMPALGQRMWTT
jgi:hypothetical protein